MAMRKKGAHTPKMMPGHVSSNRMPGMSKREYSGPKVTKPNFSPKLADRNINNSGSSKKKVY